MPRDIVVDLVDGSESDISEVVLSARNARKGLFESRISEEPSNLGASRRRPVLRSRSPSPKRRAVLPLLGEPVQFPLPLSTSILPSVCELCCGTGIIDGGGSDSSCPSCRPPLPPLPPLLPLPSLQPSAGEAIMRAIVAQEVRRYQRRPRLRSAPCPVCHNSGSILGSTGSEPCTNCHHKDPPPPSKAEQTAAYRMNQATIAREREQAHRSTASGAAGPGPVPAVGDSFISDRSFDASATATDEVSATNGTVDRKTLSLARECAACLEPATHAVIPCGHVCACEGCRKKMSKCPICRGKAQKFLRIY